MNNLSTFTLCSALSGLFFLTASFDNRNDGLAADAKKSTDFIPSLVGTHWQMTDFKLDKDIDLDGDGQLDANLMVFLKPCELDNTVTFEPNGIMAVDMGELHCNDRPEFSTPKLGHWHYDKATNSLSIVNPVTRKASTWKIIDASAKSLKVKATTTQDEPSSTATMTWKAL